MRYTKNLDFSESPRYKLSFTGAFDKQQTAPKERISYA